MRFIAFVTGLVICGSALGVGTSTWLHTSEADFRSGTFDNVVATNLGDLKLSRAVRVLMDDDPQVSAVYALAEGRDGTIYAGTGPHGMLLAIKDDSVKTIATFEDAINIFSLLVDQEGHLLVGTAGEKGRIVRLERPGDPKGKAVEVFAAEGVQYIWQMRQTPDGNIYAATGPNGQLYEITPDGNKRIVLDSDENNLTALASDGKDTLYVGTDPNGLVYRVNRNTGESFVLFDAPEAEVSAVLLDRAGNLYAATAEAKEGTAASAAAATEAVGRPEGGATGVPIRSEPPAPPKPPQLPDPNPGQPKPIPKGPVGGKWGMDEWGMDGWGAGSVGGRSGNAVQDLVGGSNLGGWRTVSPLSPVLRGEGRGEGPDSRRAQFARSTVLDAPPLTLALSPEYRGEGTRRATGGAGAGLREYPGTTSGNLSIPQSSIPHSPFFLTAADAEDDDLLPPPVPTPPANAGASTRPSRGPMPGQQPAVNAAGAQPRPDGNAIYRIDRDGFVTEIFRQNVLILGMVESEGREGEAPSLLVATGSEGQLYQVNPAAEETVVLAKVEPRQIMSLLPGKGGRVYMGMANVGAIAVMSPGFAETGTFTSPVLDAGQISRFGKMRLTGSLAGETKLSVSFRSGNVQDAAERGWSPWSDPAAATEYLQVAAPSARFLQYRLTFASDKGASTPVVQDVNVAYQVPNLPPVIRSVRVTPQPEQVNANEPEAPRIPIVRKYSIAWEAADPNGDTLHYALYFRRGVDSPWILLKERHHEVSFEWDTRSVADGQYELKVVATDEASNVAGQHRAASRVSDPVFVDNTAPVVGDVKATVQGRDVRIEFRVVDRTGVILAADYVVDSDRHWRAVLPSDTIWDSPEETAAFTVSGLAPGTHQVTVRATDARGNQAFESVVVNVPKPE